MTLIVNLFAGPGAGKSTTAAGVFSLLKLHGVNCELVTEYAKDATWRNMKEVLRDQLFVFGKQNHRVFSVDGKVDVVITDSPIMLILVYGEGDYHLRQIVMDRFFQQINMNFFIHRVKPYHESGRNQKEKEAIELDNKIVRMLCKRHVDYTPVDGNSEGVNMITRSILKYLGKRTEFMIIGY